MAERAKAESERVSAEEDRILRLWTPILLRTILIVAMVMLLLGLVLTARLAPGYLVDRYHQAQLGHLLGGEKFSSLWRDVVAGKPHTVLILGLFVLTLVPLARVAFCFALFIKERDRIYILFTAYVLAGLVVGILLGRMG